MGRLDQGLAGRWQERTVLMGDGWLAGAYGGRTRQTTSPPPPLRAQTMHLGGMGLGGGGDGGEGLQGGSGNMAGSRLA